MLNVKLSTRFGDFSLLLDTEAAPVTSQYFLDLIRADELDELNIVRIVNKKNSSEDKYPIEIIQLATDANIDEAELSQDPVLHESTDVTGLRHKKWSVSAARFEVGFLYKSFFICMRDEPELDAGGRRNSDGQGFAVFGEVSEGFNVLQDIFEHAQESEMIDDPIKIEQLDVINNEQ